MRTVAVFNKGMLAGLLTEENPSNGSGYIFRYDDLYFRDESKSAISLTLPKTQQEYHSEKIFPFFSNMVSEGVNLQVQSRNLKVDERDIMGLLLSTAETDTIGSVTIKPI